MNALKALVCAAAISLFGCGGKQPAKPADTTGAPTTEAAAVNGCTTYKDMTDTGATIDWNEAIASSDMRCIKIKVNSTVGYVGNFTTHPMKSANGDAPNPFDTVVANISNPGESGEQTNLVFAAAGTFGYTCGVHPAMTGAVMVVP